MAVDGESKSHGSFQVSNRRAPTLFGDEGGVISGWIRCFDGVFSRLPSLTATGTQEEGEQDSFKAVITTSGIVSVTVS